jgi:methionine synthase I (cobalamin-dependent)
MARGPLLILDAAMGTRLIARGLDLRDDDPARWNLSHPDEVAAIHAADIAAGAAALLTNTFGANRHWLARFGLAGAVGPINRRAVAMAREAAGPGRLVIGSIGPTAAEDVAEQAELLSEAGADALIFETHTFEQAERALREVRPGATLPLLVSLYAWPDDLHGAARRLIDLGASALGGNCQNGMEPAVRLVEALRKTTDLPLIARPSAGRPGEALAGPGAFAEAVPRLRAVGPVLVGGCCGTTEAHVAALRAACYAGEVRSPSRAPGEGCPS